MGAGGGMGPSCSRRGRVSRTALPMAERQTLPSASARTSRVHSLRRCKVGSRTRSLLLIFWGESPLRVPGWPGAAASLVGAPFGVGGLPGTEALGELVQFLAAHAGEDGGGQAWMIAVRAGRRSW